MDEESSESEAVADKAKHKDREQLQPKKGAISVALRYFGFKRSLVAFKDKASVVFQECNTLYFLLYQTLTISSD